MENTKEIKTTNGYKAIIKTSLTYGESKKIQAPILNSATFDPSNGTAGQISGAVIAETNKIACNIILQKLVDPEQNELSANMESLDNLPQVDGEEIFNEINAVSSPKKKGN